MTYSRSQYDAINNKVVKSPATHYFVKNISEQQTILELSRNVLLGEVPTICCCHVLCLCSPSAVV